MKEATEQAEFATQQLQDLEVVISFLLSILKKFVCPRVPVAFFLVCFCRIKIRTLKILYESFPIISDNYKQENKSYSLKLSWRWIEFTLVFDGVSHTELVTLNISHRRTTSQKRIYVLASFNRKRDGLRMRFRLEGLSLVWSTHCNVTSGSHVVTTPYLVISPPGIPNGWESTESWAGSVSRPAERDQEWSWQSTRC